MIDVQRISVVGLGKLGASMAACFAAGGLRVIGVDNNPAVVDMVGRSTAPQLEPGLDEMFKKYGHMISATGDINEAIAESEITFVVVPTPSEKQGGFSLRYVTSVCGRIGHALSAKNDRHLVVITSTILPGSTENVLRPQLEELSGKRCGEDFGLCYNPEFIALGSVIYDFLNPDFILIGESDECSGGVLESLYGKVCNNDPVVARMKPVNAELTKIALNSFITTKITFANTLARICELLPGASVDIVTSALGLDSRIGSKCLKGAVGYGGPCFPRDNADFSFMAGELGMAASLALATDRVNREQLTHLFELVTNRLTEGGTVGILGLSYKPGTGVVEESQGLLLAQLLLDRGFDTFVYDPVAMDNARAVLEGTVRFCQTPEECIEHSDVLVIITPWEEFRRIPLDTPTRHGPPRVIVDCWGLLDKAKHDPGIRYLKLGAWNYGEKE